MTPRILVVDDGREDTFLRATLSRLGYPYDVAKCEATCVEECEQARFKIVFIDMEAACVDSDRLVRILHRRFPQINVVSVSADDDPDALEYTLHHGATAVLVKPVASDTVAGVLASLFGEQQRFA